MYFVIVMCCEDSLVLVRFSSHTIMIPHRCFMLMYQQCVGFAYCMLIALEQCCATLRDFPAIFPATSPCSLLGSPCSSAIFRDLSATSPRPLHGFSRPLRDLPRPSRDLPDLSATFRVVSRAFSVNHCNPYQIMEHHIKSQEIIRNHMELW